MSSQSNPIATAQKLRGEFLAAAAALRAAPNPRAVEELRIDFLGRKGKLMALFESLREVSKEDRPTVGKELNELKGLVEAEIGTLAGLARAKVLEDKLKAPPVDVTLPVDLDRPGSLHPVSLMRQVLMGEFARLGFTVYDGPEIEFDFYNFSALNIPEHHPARDMQDTFYIADEPKLLLRTHTSNVQIHAMLNERPPLRVVGLGRVYRCDSDITHTPQFHQIEGFIVDTDISFAHLKGVVDHFLRAIFGAELRTRFRPSFFPFVEPGAEVDLMCVACQGKGCRVCKESGWLEVGGCGMVHPNVFEAVGYDSEVYTGFAFGFGIDRLAMLKYALADLRMLFEGNGDFLAQFPVHTFGAHLSRK